MSQLEHSFEGHFSFYVSFNKWKSINKGSRKDFVFMGKIWCGSLFFFLIKTIVHLASNYVFIVSRSFFYSLHSIIFVVRNQALGPIMIFFSINVIVQHSKLKRHNHQAPKF